MSISTLPAGEDILFKVAATREEFDDGKALFKQYVDSLDHDLDFQDFSGELEAIDSQYNQPEGALILAYNSNTAVGCAGIRKIDKDTAELKRMFVRPAFREHKIGKKLLEQAIVAARQLGYQTIRLDTWPSMVQAQQLYRSFGFYEIPPYRFNPVEGTVYLEKKLTGQQQ